MARNQAAKIRQGTRIVNGRVKPTRSASEGRGNYGNSKPKADKSVRRANEVENDPRLQRAKAQQAKHEEMLRNLDKELAKQKHVPYKPRPHLHIVQLEPEEVLEELLEETVERRYEDVAFDALDLLQQGYHVNRVAERIGVPASHLHHLVGKDGYIK